MRGRGDTGSGARRRAQVHCSPIEMDWLVTCSNSEVFLMRISLQMRSWRNWTAPSRTISSRAREGGCYQPSRRRVIENDCERDQVVFDQQPLAQVPWRFSATSTLLPHRTKDLVFHQARAARSRERFVWTRFFVEPPLRSRLTLTASTTAHSEHLRSPRCTPRSRAEMLPCGMRRPAFRAESRGRVIHVFGSVFCNRHGPGLIEYQESEAPNCDFSRCV